jgi:hypothetical protein
MLMQYLNWGKAMEYTTLLSFKTQTNTRSSYSFHSRDSTHNVKDVSHLYSWPIAKLKIALTKESRDNKHLYPE